MPAPKRRVRYFTIMALLATAGLVASALYVKHRAASILSDYLSNKTGLTVSVKLVDAGLVSGITVYGVKIENPPGYVSPTLIEIPAVTVVPDFREIASGRTVIKAVYVNSPTVTLEKDASGAWNAARALETYRARNPQTGRPLPDFAVQLISVSSARLDMPGVAALDGPVKLDMFVLDGLAIKSAEPAKFDYSISLPGGPDITGDGSMAPFAPEPYYTVRAAVHTEKLDKYAKLPASVDVKGAVLDAVVEAGFKTGVMDAKLDVSISGAQSAFTGKKNLSAGLSANAAYDIKSDALTLESARLASQGLPVVTASGSINGIKKDMLADILLDAADVELGELAVFMPPGAKLTGRAQLSEVRLKGPLKPFRASAEADMSVVDMSASYRGRGVSGVSGGTNVKYEGGRMSGRYDFRLAGGGLTGGFGYGKDGTKLRFSAIKVDLAKIEGLPAGLQGIIDADVEAAIAAGVLEADCTMNVDGVRAEDSGKSITDNKEYSLKSGNIAAKITGNIKTNPKSFDIAYTLEASGATQEAKGLSVAYIASEGRAVVAGKEISAHGKLSAGGIGYKGRVGDASTVFGWDGGKLTLTEPRYTDMDAELTASKLAASYKDGILNAALENCKLRYGKDFAAVDGLSAKLYASIADGALKAASATLSAAGASSKGVKLDSVAVSAKLVSGDLDCVLSAMLYGNPLNAKLGSRYEPSQGLIKPALSGNLVISNIASLQPALAGRTGKFALSGGSLDVTFDASGENLSMLSGGAVVKLDGLEAASGTRKLSGISTELRPEYRENRLTLPESKLDFGGSFALTLSGEAVKGDNGWSAKAAVTMPATETLSVQEGLLELLPPTLAWADVTGSVGAKINAARSETGVTHVTGSIELDGVTVSIPDKKIFAGPIDGRLPIDYTSGGKLPDEPPPFRGEVFDREHFAGLAKSYSALPPDADLVIEKLSYGFVALEAVAADLAPGPGYYDIGWFGLSMFDGRLYGYGRADLTGASSHTLSLIVDGLSTKAVCDSVPAIKGYLSGRVDGLTRIAVSGGSLEDIAGASLFWAREGKDEDMEISKEFIKKLMGPSMKKYMLIGDRGFDKGELEVVFLEGDLVFETLLIENTTFYGKRNLYITVAPVANSISLSNLLDVIQDVSARAKR